MAVVASPEMMDEAANIMENNTEEIDALLNSMKQHVGAIGENWVDENGQTFNEKFEELKAEMPGYINRAHAGAAFMKGVSNAYRETINLNARAVNTDQRV